MSQMFSGIVTDAGTLATQRKPSFADMLTRIQPNGSSPLFLLLNKMRKGTALQTTHGYWTETLPNVKLTLGAAVADGVATSFTVTSSADVIPNQLYRATTTGEIVQVTAIPDATHVTVVRGFGNVAGAAIANGVTLLPVGTAFEQGSTRPTAQRMQQSLINNYTQIFRNAWAVSGTAQSTEFYQEAGGNPMGKDKIDSALFHSIDIERALLWGQKQATTKNGQPLTTMDGLESVLRQYAAGNIQTAGGTTTYAQLETLLDTTQTSVTAGSTNERLLFVGNTAMKVINGIGRISGQYQILQGQTEFGLRFESFKTTLGVYHCIIHPLLNQDAFTSKMAIAVDPASMRLAYMRSRDTQHALFGANGQIATDNSIDATGGVYTSELTTEIVNPAAHAIIYGLTAAA